MMQLSLPATIVYTTVSSSATSYVQNMHEVLTVQDDVIDHLGGKKESIVLLVSYYSTLPVLFEYYLYVIVIFSFKKASRYISIKNYGCTNIILFKSNHSWVQL